MQRDRCEIDRQFQAVDGAYRVGDLEALKAALDHLPDFPNCRQPFELGVGEFPLEYAIYWSPRPFIAALLDLGADPNYRDSDGFPSLIAALSTDRPDRHAILTLLLEKGADLGQRGVNDWTPLHYAVSRRDLAAIELLLGYGADPSLKTRVDYYSTPLEDAERDGFMAAAEMLRAARPSRGGSGS
jgi:ankyrin repeat protein